VPRTDPAGPDPAGPDPAGPDPAGPDPAGPDPAGPDPAGPDGAPDPPGPDLADIAARLGRLLHAAGVEVTAQGGARFATTMALSPPLTTTELYWMARVTLTAGRHQIEIFDSVFAQVFGGLVDPAQWRGDQPDPPPVKVSAGGPRPRGPEVGPDAPGQSPGRAPRPSALGDDDSAPDPLGEAVVAALSAEERLRVKDFAALSAEELLALRALSARMAFVTPPRRARRAVRSRRGSDLDVRATLRRARRSGGEPLVAVRRHRRSRPRRLVLICDVSGSMEPYARAYLQLLMSGVGGARAEAFVFATRLTRLTRALKASTPEEALRRAARAAPDWSGGTRIGAAIKTFNTEHGRRGVARGAVVVVLSDGWDRGQAEVLGTEMARLRRLAYRVIWVNPRRAAEGFLPLTAGMAAAMPHVDTFLSGHSLAAFDEVLSAIAGEGEQRRS